jgi:phospholipid/cholesterol/gamma-HCH transport system substrate-binding protein
MFTYPFPDASADAVQGDYTNLRITADIDLRNILSNLRPSGAPSVPGLPGLPVPSTPALPSVPGLPALPNPGGLASKAPKLPTTIPTPSVSVPVPPPGGGGTSGGNGTCVAGICLGAPRAGTAYDMNLAALMMGGYA